MSMTPEREAEIREYAAQPAPMPNMIPKTYMEDLLAEIDALRAENTELRRITNEVYDKVFNVSCVYCDWVGGHKKLGDDEKTGELNRLLREHVATCPKHPQRVIEAQRDAALADAAAMRAENERLRKSVNAAGPVSITQNLTPEESDLVAQRDAALADAAEMRDALRGLLTYQASEW